MGIDYVALSEEMYSSEGWRILNKIKVLQLSNEIFMANYQDLCSQLAKYENDGSFASQLILGEDEELLEAYLGEVTRYLHNFLASVKTLVDHTRVFCMEEYKDSPFFQEYSDEINKRFINVDLTKFIQDLRNYTLHKKLPLTDATLVFDATNGNSQSIMLDIEDLKSWEKWTAASVRYMEGIKKRIRLKEIVDEYALITNDFYNWLAHRQEELHQKEINEWDLLRVNYNFHINEIQEKLKGI